MPSLSSDQGRLPLAGQLVVFTGKLSSLGRRDARALVTRLGGVTADDVNAKTTMLIVGAEGFGPTLGADEEMADAVPGSATTVLPLFSARFATCNAAQIIAPLETPTGIPSN